METVTASLWAKCTSALSVRDDDAGEHTLSWHRAAGDDRARAAFWELGADAAPVLALFWDLGADAVIDRALADVTAGAHARWNDTDFASACERTHQHNQRTIEIP